MPLHDKKIRKIYATLHREIVDGFRQTGFSTATRLVLARLARSAGCVWLRSHRYAVQIAVETPLRLLK